MTARPLTLDRSDFFRYEALGTDVTVPRKEWHHFIVHGDGGRVIINFSIGDRVYADVGVPTPRVIILVHHDEWAGWIEEIRPEAIELDGSKLRARFGDSTLEYVEDGYRVDLHLPRAGIRGRMRFTPQSESVVMSNQTLGAWGRFSWLFVPRLVADGWMMAGGTRFSMRGAPAYHDHNWGRFRWGDDFGWDWGSILPSDPRHPWSIVFWRVTDRAHTVSFGQGLSLWKHGAPFATFRDTDLSIETPGFLGKAPRVTIPQTLALAMPGTASDVPSRVRMVGAGEGESLTVEFMPHEYGRIVIPSETDYGTPVVLNEVSGIVDVRGSIKGEAVEIGGTGVFEFLR